ncbi:pentapeptide repeat-containing protein [Rhizobium tumorigenes]|uniref:Pentapeptide repeat-containing protein n=1 Tax=Rhizobium tumorigenes TaxID=2041385 RepID=A0AAF1KCL1_9HYPH|nr:pentapeptide repeat-containing protein [Rhizobium tumorigenes]WFR96291.1 pentapeptide repeat-containing protein [Rhizobium tumorigenes]
MAIARHLQWLKQGPSAWNNRRASRHFVPSLRNADLRGFDLVGVNLRGAQLSGANLAGADLTQANLIGAHLNNANLIGADLEFAKLTAAVLTSATLQAANLRNASLDECDFERADLRECDLRHAVVFRSNFLNARLKGANMLSEEGPAVALHYVSGLQQRQLNDILGDRGVVLPPGLEYPESWPDWRDPDLVADKNGLGVEPTHTDEASQNAENLVLLSYSSLDRQIVSHIRSILSIADITTWWDQDIAAGSRWREQIDDHLSEAAAVVTFWTSNSVASSAVKEEATRAQTLGKFIHVRLDGTPIPYGFSETQYADLQSWDGSADHIEMRKLIQSIKDKINPPTFEQIQERLTFAAPLAGIVEDGKISARDSPPTAAPPHPDEDDLEKRLEAQYTLAKKLLAALEALENNLGEAIRFDLAHYVNQLEKRPASWYILSDSVADIRYYLEMDEEFSWPGSTRTSAESLCRNHEALRPRLQPIQPPPSSSDAPLPPPPVDASKLSEQALKEITEAAVEAFNSLEAEKVLSKPAIQTGEYLAVEIADARVLNPVTIRSEEQKLRKLRTSVTALAGFVGSTIAAIGSGVGSNLLTSPEAARTLAEVLKKLFAMLTNLF